MEFQESTQVPRHVAVIMDGNGRWAQSKNRPRLFGHKNGAKRVRELVETAGKSGVKYLTLYAFSEENWKRPEEEVKGLFLLLSQYLQNEIGQLHENNVRLRGIGNRHKLPVKCLKLLEEGERLTKDNTGLHLILALSYSGRSDIVEAMRKIAELVSRGALKAEDITEESITAALSTSDIPDPDLLIRTSGEQRLSNFLLWEISYCELYFTPKHWPEFRREDFQLALKEYEYRNRRFGGVIPTKKSAPAIKTVQQSL